MPFPSLARYNAGMFEQSLELSDVLERLKRADESLAEFIAPLWPGVALAAAWIEGAPRLLRLEKAPDAEGYYLLRIADETATVVRVASEDEARKFRGYLTKASVILLDDGMAFPASSVERLQGMTAPCPLHFAPASAQPLTSAQARYDGLNLLFDGGARQEKALSPLEELFAEVEIFTPGELLGVPGTETAGDDAEQALGQLRINADLRLQWTLQAIVEAADAVLVDWSRAGEGARVRWRKMGDEHSATIAHVAAPITSGISLAGTRGFDPGRLSRLLHEHILDGWERPVV